MIDSTDNRSALHYASLEARLGDVVRDSRHATAWRMPWYSAGVAVFGVELLRGENSLFDSLPTLPMVVAALAVGISLLLAVYHLVLESRARRREFKARVLLLDGELLQARVAAMRAALG